MSFVRVALIVGLIALAVRVPAVGRFATVDEQTWIVRSHDFMESMAAGNLAGTFQGTHPGATAMWLMGSGIKLQEWRLDVSLNSDNLTFFHKAAAMPIAVVTSLLIALIAGLLVLLIGSPAALVAGILLACEPYLVGMSQVAHLDALQALLMLSALLLWVRYVRDRRRSFFYATGVIFGLALGVKLLLALWLLPSFVGILILHRWSERRLRTLWRSSGALAGVIAIALVVFVLIWPAVLTKADLQLGYISRDTVTIVTDEHGAYESADNPIDLRTFYARTMLGRVSPYVQILVVGAVVWLFLLLIWRLRGRAFNSQSLVPEARLALWLILYSFGFLILITLAAKKADRYALPALAAWPIIAGIVVSIVWPKVTQRLAVIHRWRRLVAGLAGLAVIAVPLLWIPHAIAYFNPLFPDVRPLTQQGWGEGLEAAAAWLNQQPGADQMYIASWYPSVTRMYFRGRTLGLSSRDDYRVQYLVTYRNMGGRAGDDQASDVLDELRDKEPVYTVFIQGVPYARIYETRSVGNFTKHIGELTGAKTVGQTVQPKPGRWSSIDLGFATFSSRNNTEDVVVHVRRSPTDTENIRTVRVNARQIVDNEWQRFSFEPIDVASNQQFYVEITSPTSRAGNAVTVRYTDFDILPGQMHLNGQSKPADIAYRIEH